MRSDDHMMQAESILHTVHVETVRHTLVVTLSDGQAHQLEIALTVAGAPRFIGFDQPTTALSPTEHRHLVSIPNVRPKHIGYIIIIIEHDIDVAPRVSEYVTTLHNGRLFKEGTPEEIEDDPQAQEVHLGGCHG